MKKAFLNLAGFTFTLAACLSLASCNQEKDKIALLIDSPTISDHSYQYGTYLALKNYLNNKGYKEDLDYRAYLTNEDDKDLMKMVANAVAWGAKGIILNGYQFMEVAYEAQNTYPNVKFMVHDSVPMKNNQTEIKENTLSITYKEHELGYLAGYVSALDGYRNFGYIGGVKEDVAVVRFGVGYLAGLHQAMADLNTTINISGYKYIGSYELNKGGREIAKNMYDNNAEVIFAACGYATGDVISEAESQNKMVIAPDIDQSYLSEQVLTSALKVFDASIKTYLDRFFGTWVGGESISLGIKDHAVGLPTTEAAWRFKNVTKEKYNSLYDEILLKADTIPSSYDALKSYVDSLGQTMQVSKTDVE